MDEETVDQAGRIIEESRCPFGLYRFIPSALYKLDAASAEDDRRLPIDLATRRSRPIRQ